MKITFNSTKSNIKFILFIILSLLQTSIMASDIDDKSLVVYTSRSKHLVKPFFDKYKEQTGIEIKYITAKAGVLRQKLILEGQNTVADILMTVDSGNLWQATEDGLLQSIRSKVLLENIPKNLRDEKNRWFGLTVRARTIVYSPTRVSENELSNYIDLADAKWQGRLCLRTSKKVYNQSLVAMLISHFGEEKTEKVVKGWVRNLAKSPFAKDGQVIKSIANGVCDLGIVNTYYYGRELVKDPSFKNKVKLHWAGQDKQSFGTHINISGAGVIKHSKKKAQAQNFIEWLSSPEIQADFASINLEYPVKASNTINIKNVEKVIPNYWEKFKRDNSSIHLSGVYQTRAVKLMDRANYR